MSDWADLEANTLAHPILGVVRQGIKSKADGVIPPDNGPMISFEEWASRLIARTLREAYERGAADMKEMAEARAKQVAEVEANPGMPMDDVIHTTWQAASLHIASEIRALPTTKEPDRK